ncbi:MAG TPA: beta-ketoacyl-[acyl-carrier-protein] synthase II, partial [Anaerolineae bacterium]|nr:beta-ketoacyl-[acyl-carrier-protein] synthase II [Anaerolineae bacterium]
MRSPVMSRIVITGLGAVTPIGSDVETFWRNLTAGVSGIDFITRFDTTNFPVHTAAEVKGFDAASYIGRKLARRTGRAAQLALVAARQAIADAGLTIGDSNAPRIGIVLNTALAGTSEMEQGARSLLTKGPRSLGPFLIPSV